MRRRTEHHWLRNGFFISQDKGFLLRSLSEPELDNKEMRSGARLETENRTSPDREMDFHISRVRGF
ncbi:hypothetical protein, partial [Litoribacterium kuwaitense]|uniref:hypothetical protein n=1 Tax=Litoribacterium kuwaitense TaxID=1398745 RepID=UPI001BADE9EB